MKSTMSRVGVLGGMIVALAALAGCTTTTAKDTTVTKKAPAYVESEPEIGSHIKRRAKPAEVKQVGMSPTAGGKVTPETDTMIMPPTAGEMEKMIRNP